MTGGGPYTIADAARRVRRDRRTIKRWIAHGLPTHLILCPDQQWRRYITEDDLLTYLRRTLRENPTRPAPKLP